MIKITVNTSKQYDVLMEYGALGSAGEYICAALDANIKSAVRHALPSNGRKICIITDTTVNRLYGQPEHSLWQSLKIAGFEVYSYVFPGGESHKNMATVVDILEHLAENYFTRNDALLAFGGGMVGDVTGFVAASYLRGIDYIQIPTTLLATVDSSVGGKTGVNLTSGKNLAGAFWQPRLVLFDPNVLETLPDETKIDGIAEAIKVGIIAAPDILTLIESGLASLNNNDILTKLAAMAIDVKRRIVEDDERESGKRQLLNLGHTIAHAIEKCSDYTIRHGHAVAIGMSLIANAACSRGWCNDECRKTINLALKAFNFPLDCPYNAEKLAHAALHDKKRRGEFITLVIPEEIGRCVLKQMPVTELETFFKEGLERN